MNVTRTVISVVTSISIAFSSTISLPHHENQELTSSYCRCRNRRRWLRGKSHPQAHIRIGRSEGVQSIMGQTVLRSARHTARLLQGHQAQGGAADIPRRGAHHTRRMLGACCRRLHEETIRDIA